MRRFDLTDLDPSTSAGVASLNEVLDALGAGGVIALPSATGWRLATCSQDPARATRLLELSARPPDRPLTYLIPSLGILESIFEDQIPTGLEARGAEVWPGTTTLVVDADPVVLPQARFGHPQVALRIPVDSLLRRLMAGLPPLASVPAPGQGPTAVLALADFVDVLLELPQPPRAPPGRVLYLRADGSTQVLRG